MSASRHGDVPRQTSLDCVSPWQRRVGPMARVCVHLSATQTAHGQQLMMLCCWGAVVMLCRAAWHLGARLADFPAAAGACRQGAAYAKAWLHSAAVLGADALSGSALPCSAATRLPAQLSNSTSKRPQACRATSSCLPAGAGVCAAVSDTQANAMRMLLAVTHPCRWLAAGLRSCCGRVWAKGSMAAQAAATTHRRLPASPSQALQPPHTSECRTHFQGDQPAATAHLRPTRQQQWCPNRRTPSSLRSCSQCSRRRNQHLRLCLQPHTMTWFKQYRTS